MIEDALALLDQFLNLTVSRENFPSDEVQDFVLDLRSALTRVPEPVA